MSKILHHKSRRLVLGAMIFAIILGGITAHPNELQADNESRFSTYRIAAPSLYVRNRPGMDSDIIGILYEGELIQAARIEDSVWARISTGGFVSSRFLRLVSGQQTGASKRAEVAPQRAPAPKPAAPTPKPASPAQAQSQVLVQPQQAEAVAPEPAVALSTASNSIATGIPDSWLIFGLLTILGIMAMQWAMVLTLLRRGANTTQGSNDSMAQPVSSKSQLPVTPRRPSGLIVVKSNVASIIKQRRERKNLARTQLQHKIGIMPLLRFIHACKHQGDLVKNILLEAAEAAIDHENLALDLICLEYWTQKLEVDMRKICGPEFKVAMERFTRKHSDAKQRIPHDFLAKLLTKLEQDVSLMGRDFRCVAAELAELDDALIHRTIAQRLNARDSAVLLALMPPARAAAHLELLSPPQAAKIIAKMRRYISDTTLGLARSLVMQVKAQTTPSDRSITSDPLGNTHRYWQDLAQHLSPELQSRVVERATSSLTSTQQSEAVLDQELTALVSSHLRIKRTNARDAGTLGITTASNEASKPQRRIKGQYKETRAI